ncbi:MAG TPA: dockerin type I domain-containing protein [Candidatus Dormibacteraeota bacterium]|nr:dockerin type I domain-containing protein [Candidatus Dormibacteraeota bacterium]
MLPNRHGSAALALAALLLAAAAAGAQDPFADAVVDLTVGDGGGFGTDMLPGIVLGPPRGGGAVQQSLDVVSLGNDGVITLRFDLPLICDGPGPDFTVFENAFHVGTPEGPIFEEYGIVSVSQDGVTFVDLPYDPVTHAGLAGRTPVLSNPDNGVDPLDPAVSGGDAFDLASVGLAWVAYVRITDPGAAIPDPGDRIPPGDKGGFDLDAIAALHACDPGDAASPTPTFTPTATPTPPSAATATAIVPVPGDVDGDGSVGEGDRAWLVRELFDGDGDERAAAGGGGVASGPAVDVNDDDRITAADLAAIGARAR